MFLFLQNKWTKFLFWLAYKLPQPWEFKCASSFSLDPSVFATSTIDNARLTQLLNPLNVKQLTPACMSHLCFLGFTLYPRSLSFVLPWGTPLLRSACCIVIRKFSIMFPPPFLFSRNARVRFPQNRPRVQGTSSWIALLPSQVLPCPSLGDGCHAWVVYPKCYPINAHKGAAEPLVFSRLSFAKATIEHCWLLWMLSYTAP